jgi:TctA family transporter
MMTTVGVDITLGFPRFTFGVTDFLNGFTFIPAMIGMFGVSEVMRNVSSEDSNYSAVTVQTKKMFSGVLGTVRKYKLNVARSGLIGTFVGILPGAGADIGAWIAYAVSKKFSKEPEKSVPGISRALLTPVRPTTPDWAAPGCRPWYSVFPVIPSPPS